MPVFLVMAKETNLVRRDQFNISPQGIVHKPTDAGFDDPAAHKEVSARGARDAVAISEIAVRELKSLIGRLEPE
jgi:hypothetical protein